MAISDAVVLLAAQRALKRRQRALAAVGRALKLLEQRLKDHHEPRHLSVVGSMKEVHLTISNACWWSKLTLKEGAREAGYTEEQARRCSLTAAAELRNIAPFTGCSHGKARIAVQEARKLLGLAHFIDISDEAEVEVEQLEAEHGEEYEQLTVARQLQRMSSDRFTYAMSLRDGHFWRW